MNVFVKLISDACDLVKHMLSDVPGHRERDGWGNRLPVFETQEDYPREPLILPMPMSSGDRIEKDQVKTVWVRPQTMGFVIEKILLDDESGSSSDWIIHDVKVGNCSQLTVAGSIPGNKFFYQDMKLATIQTAMDFSLVVEYRGSDPEGKIFKATAWGRSV